MKNTTELILHLIVVTLMIAMSVNILYSIDPYLGNDEVVVLSLVLPLIYLMFVLSFKAGGMMYEVEYYRNKYNDHIRGLNNHLDYLYDGYANEKNRSGQEAIGFVQDYVQYGPQPGRNHFTRG